MIRDPKMIKLLVSGVIAAILTGCTVATPVLVAEAGGHQLARASEDAKVRYAAALRDEPDLLTFSLQAISSGKTEEAVRSEEHTSELQSRPHLVCRLLLEKKKKK